MPSLLIRAVQFAGETCDLLLRDGLIIPAPDATQRQDARIIEASGLTAIPGLRDRHVHFREPGFPQKEDLLSGSRAAAAGGYVAVCCEPNTLPVIDSEAGVADFYRRVQEVNIPLQLSTKIALTKGQRGEELSDFPLQMLGQTIPAVSSDGEPVPVQSLLAGALRAIDGRAPIDLHCEETPRSAALVRRWMGDGAPGAREAELITVALQALCEAGCGSLHIQHVSLAESVRLLHAAQKQGLRVSAEVSPHHLLLCADDIPVRDGQPDANWKMNPPLRTRDDMRAVRQAVAEGVIRTIATDHAPHTPAEKALPWEQAPFGVIGLETAFAACLSLVHAGELTLPCLLAAMSGQSMPNAGAGVEGLALVDLQHTWTVDAARFYSRSRNCPFDGESFRGKVCMTLLNATDGWQVLMADGELLF